MVPVYVPVPPSAHRLSYSSCASAATAKTRYMHISESLSHHDSPMNGPGYSLVVLPVYTHDVACVRVHPRDYCRHHGLPAVDRPQIIDVSPHEPCPHHAACVARSNPRLELLKLEVEQSRYWSAISLLQFPPLGPGMPFCHTVAATRVPRIARTPHQWRR